jgi:type I restriction enzyme R subunit
LADANKNPEQIARDAIDARLAASGWSVQSNKNIDFSAAMGVAVREYPTSVGPADYAQFADRRAVGVVEAKPDSWGAKITTVEGQSSGYAGAELERIPFSLDHNRTS